MSKAELSLKTPDLRAKINPEDEFSPTVAQVMAVDLIFRSQKVPKNIVEVIADSPRENDIAIRKIIENYNKQIESPRKDVFMTALIIVFSRKLTESREGVDMMTYQSVVESYKHSFYPSLQSYRETNKNLPS